MNSIVFLDVIYIFFALATTTLLLIYRKKLNFHITSIVPIVGLSIVQVLYGVIMFLEWYGISSSFEKYEDIVGTLIPMFWMFVLYALFQYVSNSDLRESEARMQSVIKATQAGLWDWNFENNKLNVNSRWFEMIGYNENEFDSITFQTWKDLLHPDDFTTASQIIETHINTQSDLYECDVRMKHKNGEWIWVHTRGSVVEYNSSGRPIRMAGTHIDISEKKKIELELEEYRINLEELVKARTLQLAMANDELNLINNDVNIKNEFINAQNEELQNVIADLNETQLQLLRVEKMASLGILTAGVAHEINNPLNFIKGGCVELEYELKNETFSEPDKISVLLNYINTGVDRISAIVQSLNKFSRTNDGSASECDLVEIIENCLVMLNGLINNRIEIKKDYAVTSSVIVGNSSDLHQVMLSVLTNAIQAIANQGTITINIAGDAKYIVTKISDNGCGITEKNMPHLIDPFYTTKDPGDGVGLGLSLTYSIIKSHNGTMEFESEPGIGTTVKIVLPINQG